MRMVLALMATLAASSALAQTASRSRCATWARSTSAAGMSRSKGQPVKEMVFTPGGVPAKVDPNGVYQVEQMYAQYFLAAETARASCRC